MPVRRRIVGRSNDGRKLEAIAGDPLPWKYDRDEDAFWVNSPDGKAKYVVKHMRPTDKGGFRYWAARVMLNEPVNLGDEYMIAWEGKEVCQIYESERHSKVKTTLEAMRKVIIDYHTRDDGE